MHCCGNLAHDIPVNLMALAPLLAPLALWLRMRFKKRCECGHDHAEDHEHV